jgi:2-polyprenyl-3-methyl-5-hydroxy-6-metoxy-1,4-benzoquinol methylase
MGLDGRRAIVRSLLPERPERLLDVGCGPITSEYPFADKALRVTCIDWNLKTPSSLPSNVECLNADFTSIDLAPDTFDSVIAADVFEHIPLEQEALFVSKCVSVLRPGGSVVISVPHRGTFAWLDPYQVKPAVHRMLARLRLYNKVHNGCCDIRKGHKHYSLEELADKFRPLQVTQVVYFGYLFDPLSSWAVALSRGSGWLPGYSWLQRARSRELDREYGERSFNIAVSFHLPSLPEVAKSLSYQS